MIAFLRSALEQLHTWAAAVGLLSPAVGMALASLFLLWCVWAAIETRRAVDLQDGESITLAGELRAALSDVLDQVNRERRPITAGERARRRAARLIARHSRHVNRRVAAGRSFGARAQ